MEGKIKVTIAKVKAPGMHYWQTYGNHAEFICSGGSVDWSVDGRLYWERGGRCENVKVFIDKESKI